MLLSKLISVWLAFAFSYPSQEVIVGRRRPSTSLIMMSDHASATCGGGTCNATTGAMGCGVTGTDFMVVWAANVNAIPGTSSITLANPSVTLTRAGSGYNGVSHTGAFFYTYNQTLTNSTTVTFTGSIVGAVFARCYSGILATSDPLDSVAPANANCTSGTTCLSNAVGSSFNGDLIVSGIAAGDVGASPFSINLGFNTPIDSISPVISMGGSSSDFIQGTAGSIQPTWTLSSSITDDIAANIAFKHK